jgi:hypothetical protein
MAFVPTPRLVIMCVRSHQTIGHQLQSAGRNFKITSDIFHKQKMDQTVLNGCFTILALPLPIQPRLIFIAKAQRNEKTFSKS